MFQQRHEHRFTTEDSRKVKINLENGKGADPALLRKPLYIGTMAFCRGYVSMLTNDQKVKPRVMHMATNWKNASMVYIYLRTCCGMETTG